MRLMCFALSMIFSLAAPVAFAATDDFDFNNFAIVDSGDADLTMSGVSINAGAKPITVNNFDIAGIMLGMSFEDVENLFFKTKSGL